MQPQLSDLPRGIDVLADGRLSLRRHNRQLENYLNKHFTRCDRALRWAIKGPIYDLENQYSGECTIVGKGPSLDRLSDFENQAPVFCLNEAIQKVETLDCENELFAVRQDPPKGKLYLPKRATLIITKMRAKLYREAPKVILVTPYEFQQAPNCLTVLLTLKIIRLLGFSVVHMRCFDACTKGDTAYADCIGFSAATGGPPDRFLGHRAKIEHAAQDLQLIWH